MIARIWNGTAQKASADAYERLVQGEIFPEIEAKAGAGLKGMQLLRQEKETEVEFTTIIWFQDLDSVKKFAGEEYENAYIPERARKFLRKYDEKTTHAELRFNSL